MKKIASLILATLALALSTAQADTTNLTAMLVSRRPLAIAGGAVTCIDQHQITLKTGNTYFLTNLAQLTIVTNVVHAGAESLANSTNFGLSAINTAAGKQAVQAAFESMMTQGAALGMTPEQSQKLGTYFQTTTAGLANGTIDLGSIRNQAAATLKQMHEYRQERDADPHAQTWRQYEAVLQDFVTRYDRGER